MIIKYIFNFYVKYYFIIQLTLSEKIQYQIKRVTVFVIFLHCVNEFIYFYALN